jgi:hypothetical protein
MANRQSGHIGGTGFPGGMNYRNALYEIMTQTEFDNYSIIPGDYWYMQNLGPWDLAGGDSLTVAFALGIGSGLSAMREALQEAYNLYWQEFRPALQPQITASVPEDSVFTGFIGEVIRFKIRAQDAQEDSLYYIWRVNQALSTQNDSIFILQTRDLGSGVYTVGVEVSDRSSKAQREWILLLQPPVSHNLEQNFPNPFNQGTTIPFQINHDTRVTIRLFDTAGRLVAVLADESLKLGKYLVQWDGRLANNNAVASGVYFYEMRAEEYRSVKKLLILR